MLSGPERLEQEAADFLLYPPAGWALDFYAEPGRVDDHYWKGWIVGPVNTPYAGGFFRFTLRFVDRWPSFPGRAPVFAFDTKIYHPNCTHPKLVLAGPSLAETGLADPPGFLGRDHFRPEPPVGAPWLPQPSAHWAEKTQVGCHCHTEVPLHVVKRKKPIFLHSMSHDPAQTHGGTEQELSVGLLVTED